MTTTTRYLIITPENHILVKQIRHDASRRGDVLKFLNDAVGGFIDATCTPDGVTCYVNDEGLLLDLPRNYIATELVYGSQEVVREYEPNLPSFVIQTYTGPLYIAGTAVFCDVDSEGDDADCPTAIIERALQLQAAVPAEFSRSAGNEW